MARLPDPDELRPADLLILYYLSANGHADARTIAETISRKRPYVSSRVSDLEAKDLLCRTTDGSAVVTLTDAGRELIDAVADTHLLPDQRHQIEQATNYSVTWE